MQRNKKSIAKTEVKRESAEKSRCTCAWCRADRGRKSKVNTKAKEKIKVKEREIIDYTANRQ